MSAHAHALAKFSPDCEECANCSPADPACGNKKHSTLKMIGQLSKKIEIWKKLFSDLCECGPIQVIVDPLLGGGLFDVRAGLWK